MDIRKDGWFGQIILPNGQPLAHNGSIMGIVSECLKDCADPRVRRADESEILIRIRNAPFDTSKESVQILGKAQELGDMLDGQADESVPIPNEAYDEYVHRLTALDYPRITVLMLAAEWFNIPKDAQAEGWLTDQKAIRFRELNSRREEFEAALPDEYERLKHYVVTHYSEFVEGIVFRTA